MNLTLTNANAYVLSDLHMAEGDMGHGIYSGTENFFSGIAFSQFVEELIHRNEENAATLIINGDFVDFIRIKEYPKKEADFRQWQAQLLGGGLAMSLDALKKSVSKKEKEIGLRTNDYKCIYKLYQSIKGHPAVFNVLKQWLSCGHKLVVISGNHDLEWYWPAVQRYLRWVLEGAAKEQTQISYAPEHVIINETVYIEHGHQYESMTKVDGPAVLEKYPDQLRLPLGSFFNRYLVNNIELAYPYVDNIRPRENILLVLLRERFPLALKLIGRQIYYMRNILSKHFYKDFLRKLLQMFFLMILPLGLTVWGFYDQFLSDDPFFEISSGIGNMLLGVLRNFAFLFLSYFFGQLMALFGLSSHGFDKVAAEILKKNAAFNTVILGHTHNPEVVVYDEDKVYMNSGTWTPVFEVRSANVRMDKACSFIEIKYTESGLSKNLYRWSSATKDFESIPTVSRK